MKIDKSCAKVSFFLLDLDGGGAERAIVALAGEIANRGYAVDLVVGYANSDYRAEVSSAVNVIDFTTRSPIGIFLRLLAYLRRSKPKVVMSALDPANIMLTFAARLILFAGRVVVSQRAVIDASLHDLGKLRRAATEFLLRVCFPRADAVISNSHAAAKEVTARLGVPSCRVFTIHNAIYTDRIAVLAQEPIIDVLINNTEKPLIVSIGSLTKRKDMGTLIRAFKAVSLKRDARLVIVGKGPELKEIQDLVSELDLTGKVYLPGFDVNPYRWMAAATVIVSSSTEEGFPNVVAEALALGRRIVATDCPGDTAVLLGHGKWGRLVPVGDHERMAESILATLDDAEPAESHVRAADFSPTKITSAYLDVLLPDVC